MVTSFNVKAVAARIDRTGPYNLFQAAGVKYPRSILTTCPPVLRADAGPARHRRAACDLAGPDAPHLRRHPHASNAVRHLRRLEMVV